MARGSGDIANVQSEPGLSSLSGVGARRSSALHSQAAIEVVESLLTANDQAQIIWPAGFPRCRPVSKMAFITILSQLVPDRVAR